jgi:hypothetical protein
MQSDTKIADKLPGSGGPGGAPKGDPARRKAFTERLRTAVENSPNVPPMYSGQHTWIIDQLIKKGITVSRETVSKWFRGDSIPSSARMEALAELFSVDVAWLEFGVHSVVTERERRSHSALARGVVNLVAGMVQMGGGTVAFPEEGDDKAARGAIDVYAIIKGAQYAFHVAIAERENGKLFLTIPKRVDGIVLAVAPRDGQPFSYEIFEVLADQVEEFGNFNRGGIEIEIPENAPGLRAITSFEQRI